MKHVGRAAYGLIPIAGIMTQYVSLISFNISSAVNRYLTVALQQNDTKEVNCIFNTAFFSYLVVSLIQMPIFWFIIHYANTLFTIPQELYNDMIILLVCSAVSFLINLVCSVFSATIYANNRIDIARGIDILKQVFRVVGIVILFVAFAPRLRYIGYVDLSITIVTTLMTITIGKRLAPFLTINLRFYDWRKVKLLLGMGSWLLINQVGALLFLRIDVWVCNRFIGAEQAGDYAAVLQWSNLIRQAGTLVSGVIAPMIIIYYARSEIERLIRLCKLSVRVLSFALAIPISVMCVFSSSLLRLWLGESFVRLAPLMVIMLCHLVINIGVSPLFNIQIAMNKVLWPGLVTLMMGILNLFLAIIFAKYLNWGIYGVAIAGGIMLTLKDALFTSFYSAIIINQSWHTFLKSSISSLLFMIGLIALGLIFNYFINPVSWLNLVLISIMIGIIGLVIASFFFSRKDRLMIFALIPTIIQSKISKLIKV